jgi:DNA-binding IclR family transcriptional regulator
MADQQEAVDAAEIDEIADAGRGLVKSAERAVLILETLAEASGRLTLGQLQERTGYPRSSLYALLRTLNALKWIETAEGELAFGIGPRALLCGTSYLDRDPALPFAAHQLESLRTEVGYTAHYARRQGENILYLATREATDSRRLTSRVGRQLPAHATALGKALLAELTPPEVERLLPARLAALTPHTVTSRRTLLGELDATRRFGWARECEQNTLGVACVAVAVPYRIPATDAISCSMPLARASEKELTRVAAAVREHCEQLAQTLRREGIR